MTFQLSRSVIEMGSTPGGRRLSSSEKLVLMLLAHHHNKKEGGAWPSLRLLAAESGLSESTVRRATQQLEVDQVIAVRKRYRPKAGNPSHRGERTSSAYYFCAVDMVPPADAWILAPTSGKALGTARPGLETEAATDLVADDDAAAAPMPTELLSAFEEWLDDECAAGRNLTEVYMSGLTAAAEIAAEYPVSPSIADHLRNAVLGHAARSLLEVGPEATPRLAKAAQVLGDPRYVLLGILHTAPSAVEGDRISYALGAANRIMEQSTMEVAA